MIFLPIDLPILVGLGMPWVEHMLRWQDVARCENRMNGQWAGNVFKTCGRKHGCPHPKSTTVLKSFEVKVHPKTGDMSMLCYCGLNPIDPHSLLITKTCGANIEIDQSLGSRLEREGTCSALEHGHLPNGGALHRCLSGATV